MTNEEKETILETCFNKAQEHFQHVVLLLHPTRDITELVSAVGRCAENFALNKYRLNAILVCCSTCGQIREYFLIDRAEQALMDSLVCCFKHIADTYRNEFCTQTE